MKLTSKIFRWTLLILLAVEITLHFYNPFIRKNTVDTYLIAPNRKVGMRNIAASNNLVQDITVSTNNLGFRGEPLNEQKTKRIFCIGGSTTECPYLGDGEDWPNQLSKSLKTKDSNIWLNNAGLQGLNSDAYVNLIKKHILPLKPSTLIIMCGLEDINAHNNDTKSSANENWLLRFYHFLEIPKTIQSLISKPQVEDKNSVFHKYLDLPKSEQMVMKDSQILYCIAKEQIALAHYQSNLQKVIDLCKEDHIQLILISQAILFGDEKDLVTNVDLGLVKTGNINGKTEALILKQFNKVTYELSQKNDVPFINLSARLPKDSRFFYDGYHFSNEGSAIVSDIIFNEIKDLVAP